MKQAVARALVAGFLVMAVMVATGTATADNGPACQQQVDTSAPGIDGMIPAPPCLQQGNQKTLAETYPATAYLPFNVDAGSVVLNAPPNPWQDGLNVAMSFYASAVMFVVLLAVTIAGRLMEWTFSVDFLTGAAPAQAAVVHALFADFYKQLGIGFVALGGLWFFLTSVRGYFTRAFQGVGWMILIMVAATFYAAQPESVLVAANNGSTTVARDLLGSVASADPALINRQNDPQYAKGPTEDAALRLAMDRLWKVYVYTPWSVAALGSQQSGANYGQELLAKNAGLHSNFDQDFLGNPKVPQADKDWYNGDQGTMRLGVTLLALSVAVWASLLILVITAAVVVAQLALLILLMLLPLVLLLAIQPEWGQDVARRWAMAALKALAVKVGAALLLVIVIVIANVIATIPWWIISAFLQLCLLAAAIWKRKFFLSIFQGERLSRKERREVRKVESARRVVRRAEERAGRQGSTATARRTASSSSAGRRSRNAATATTAGDAEGQAQVLRGQKKAAVSKLSVAEAGGKPRRKASAAAAGARRVAHGAGHVMEKGGAVLTTLQPELAPATVPLTIGGSALQRATRPASRQPMQAPAAPSPSPAPARKIRPASRQAIPSAKPAAPVPAPAPAPRPVAPVQRPPITPPRPPALPSGGSRRVA